jgi:hypothetical protein
MSAYILVHGIRIAKSFEPETFGRLTTIGPKFKLRQPDRRRWFSVFLCECGNYFVSRMDSVLSGRTQSCGCFHKETAAVQGKANTIHGHCRRIGGKNSQYSIHTGILQRCTNPNNDRYADYGGRGIRVCDRWLEPNGQGYINFLTDMGQRPTLAHEIERICNNGNYEPGNCKWATSIEQNRNKRNNHNLTYNGKTQCIAAWAEELGIHQETIRNRIKKGWPIEKVLVSTEKIRSAP